MQKAIIVVGSLNMDLVVRTVRHPKIGETILGSDFQTFPGGKGANQAVAAARLGGRVWMVGRVGQDDFGERLLQSAASDHVDTSYVQKDPHAATGVALITVDQAGQNTIVVAPGANGQVSPEDVLQAKGLFERAGVLLVQLETPFPAVRKAVEMAGQHGVQVILNPAPAPSQPLDPELLAGVDYLIPNQTELSLLSGKDDLSAGVEALRSCGVGQVIVTLGGDGALIAHDQGIQRIPAFPVKVVDTTAAGDAFVGAFAVALTEGIGVHQAVVWGNAAGALSVMRSGAQPSLPRRQDLEKFLAERK